MALSLTESSSLAIYNSGSDGAIYYQFESPLKVKTGIVIKSVRHSQNSLSKIDRIQPFPKVEDVTSIPLTVLRDELRQFPKSQA